MEYAIDFGTSNTVVARINQRGEIETVQLADYASLIADNPPLIPSFVYVKDAVNEQVFIGQEVRDRGLDRQSNKGESRFLNHLNGRSLQIYRYLCQKLMGAKLILKWWERGF